MCKRLSHHGHAVLVGKQLIYIWLDLIGFGTREVKAMCWSQTFSCCLQQLSSQDLPLMNAITNVWHQNGPAFRWHSIWWKEMCALGFCPILKSYKEVECLSLVFWHLLLTLLSAGFHPEHCRNCTWSTEENLTRQRLCGGVYIQYLMHIAGLLSYCLNYC